MLFDISAFTIVSIFEFYIPILLSYHGLILYYGLHYVGI